MGNMPAPGRSSRLPNREVAKLLGDGWPLHHRPSTEVLTDIRRVRRVGLLPGHSQAAPTEGSTGAGLV